jgi:ATP-dependent protease Clp ATPase subunit
VTKAELERLGENHRTHCLNLRCSFCGKHREKVRRLVAGSCGNICDACVQVCVDTIAADDARDAGLSEDYAPEEMAAIAKACGATHVPADCGSYSTAEKAEIKKATREIDAHLRKVKK